jgi:hypothetical protein
MLIQYVVFAKLDDYFSNKLDSSFITNYFVYEFVFKSFKIVILFLLC